MYIYSLLLLLYQPYNYFCSSSLVTTLKPILDHSPTSYEHTHGLTTNDKKPNLFPGNLNFTWNINTYCLNLFHTSQPHMLYMSYIRFYIHTSTNSYNSTLDTHFPSYFIP